MTSISILKSTCKEVGKLADLDSRKPLTTKFFTHTDNRQISISSYIQTRKRVKKNILVLSTHPKPIYGVTRDDNKKKPAVLRLYDFTKGGVDIVDHKVDNLTVKIHTSRWTMWTLFYILDVARQNAHTVRALNHSESPNIMAKAFEYTYDMAKAMVVPLIFRRIRNPAGIPWSLLDVMNRLTKDVATAPVPDEYVRGLAERRKAFKASLMGSITAKIAGSTPGLTSMSRVKLDGARWEWTSEELISNPKKIEMRKYCRACFRDSGGVIRTKELPRSKHLCEICEEPVCWTLHAFVRCPNCNQRR